MTYNYQDELTHNSEMAVKVLKQMFPELASIREAMDVLGIDEEDIITFFSNIELAKIRGGDGMVQVIIRDGKVIRHEVTLRTVKGVEIENAVKLK